ncbi:DNA-binding protein [uncultured Bacteroides sp.]|uniref:DNA-binding protein n=1 Tax=uncultured Bacteroides sp. TaxID=162156 RepID=UPI00262D6EC3|nr:DNA-binding protein [uncultured Bacteroides sp.]
MAKALAMRIQRRKKIGAKNSPLIYTLVRKPKDAKTYDLKRIATDIEALGGMSAEDVLHVARGLIRSIRQILTDGNTVKSIRRVNTRFMADSALRLVNDTNATTKGAPNNIEFELVTADSSSSSGSEGGSGSESGSGNEDCPYFRGFFLPHPQDNIF